MTEIDMPKHQIEDFDHRFFTYEHGQTFNVKTAGNAMRYVKQVSFHNCGSTLGTWNIRDAFIDGTYPICFNGDLKTYDTSQSGSRKVQGAICNGYHVLSKDELWVQSHGICRSNGYSKPEKNKRGFYGRYGRRDDGVHFFNSTFRVHLQFLFVDVFNVPDTSDDDGPPMFHLRDFARLSLSFYVFDSVWNRSMASKISRRDFPVQCEVISAWLQSLREERFEKTEYLKKTAPVANGTDIETLFALLKEHAVPLEDIPGEAREWLSKH